MIKISYGLLYIYCAVFLLALNGLFAKLIPLDALSITGLRSFIAAWGLISFGVLGRRSFRLGSFRRYSCVYALGILLGIHWATFFHAMQVSTVAVGMLSLFSFPIMTILLEPLFNKNRLAPRDIFAGVMVLVGLAVMVSQDLGDLNGSVVTGAFWGVCSALLFALRNLLQKYCFNDVPSDRLMFHQVIAVALIFLPFVDSQQVFAMESIGWGKLILLGLLSTAGAHTLYAASLKLLPAKSVALIGCLQPVVASFLAWLVVREIPQFSVLLGGGIILSVAMYESLHKR